MKLIKKLAILCTALLTAAGFSMATACSLNAITMQPIASSSEDESSIEQESSDKDSTSSDKEEEEDKEDQTPKFVYRIKVQNATGFGLKDVTVRLKNGDEVIAEKATTSTGYATFNKSDILALGSYEIEIDGIPRGYKMSAPDANYQTIAVEGFEAYIPLEPTGVIKETAPTGTRYSLGDVMYDFTVKTTEDTTFTLSKVLEEKELVLINFWATWCGPCKSEFPAMNAAYEQCKDDVAVIAISTEPSDSMSKVRDFKAANGLNFDMTSARDSGTSLAGMFNTAAIPVSIMVDRYGVITYYHAGSMTAATDFTARFNRFLGDDYKPTVIVGSGEDDGSGGEDQGSNLIKPTVAFPTLDEVKTALGGSSDFSYEWDTDDEYAWPWIVTESGNGLQASSNLDSNYSTLITKFTANAGDTFLFDYEIVTEEASDIFYVLVDGVPVYQLSGRAKDTGSYVFRDFEEGEHTVHFLYLKDGDTSIEGEIVKISNLRLENTSENAKGLVFHHAANVVNDAENPTSYYKYYATVNEETYNEEDGYYHVGTKDGPILFANLMLSSRWSETSVWLLAYSDFIITEGYNFHSDIEDFAWEANQPIPGKSLTYGYTPVTKELKALLDYAAKSEPVKEYGYKYWTGDYHENEWLEMCVYWENYGGTPALEDPMKTISFHAAEEVFAGENGSVKNTAKVLFAMTPRGFKYKFTPEASGVYNVYSVGDLDTTCFLMSSDRSMLGTYTDVIGKTREAIVKDENGNETVKIVDDYNFYFHYYFEAGETYYLLLTTYLDAACEYDFYIDYVGDSYSYLENMSVGPYSFNEVSGELFLPDAKNYTLDESIVIDVDENGTTDINGAYRIVNKDGTLGGAIYVDMTHATAFFPNNSLYQTALADRNKDKELRNFYINGTDYTDLIIKYGRLANIRIEDSDPATPSLVGYVELDQPLFEALCAITQSVRFDGISDSWQLLCYYYRTLSA